MAVLTLLAIAPALAATLTVEADGSGDYTAIGAAVAAAASGDTLTIGPGTYTEVVDLGSLDLTLVGAGADATRIDATGLGADALTARLSEVRVEGIAFATDGRAIQTSHVDLTLDGVVFDDVGATDIDGAAIHALRGTITLVDTEITRGRAALGMVHLLRGTELIATDSVFSKSEAESGTAIYAEFSEITLEGSTFEALYSASNGGAIVLLDDSTLTATDTAFLANLAYAGHGAAIYAEDSALVFDGGIFDSNAIVDYPTGFYGGAVYLHVGTASFTGARLVDNTAYGGGALFAHGAEVTFDTAEISGNYAIYGGGVYGDTSVTITDTGSTFQGNTGLYGGGALYLYYYWTLDLDGTTLSENASPAGSGGGAYNYYFGTATYNDVHFDDNVAAGYGGALYINQTYSPVTFDDCWFSGNEARAYGGAIYAYYRSDLRITGGGFFANESEQYHGGGVYGYYNTVHVDGTEFSANRAREGMGGAIYTQDGFTYDAVSTLTVVNSVFTANAAGFHGGAIASTRDDDVVVRDCSFAGNDTERSGMGGAFFADEADDLEGVDNQFFGNNAGYGGATYVNASTGEDWRNNTWQENSAHTAGGAMWIGGSWPEITNNTFVGNVDVDGAAAVGLHSTRVRFSNNIVAFAPTGAGVWSFDGLSATGAFDYNAFFDLADGPAGGELTTGHLFAGVGSLRYDDPLFSAYTANGQQDDRLTLLRDSALVDGGDPEILDVDGSRSDIGALGGPDVDVWDGDNDGYPNWIDCHDGAPAIHPDATELYYDGVETDCISGSDWDADRDGVDAEEFGGDDCDDTDPDVIYGCTDDDPIDTDVDTDTEAPLDRDVDPTGCGCAAAPTAPTLAVLVTALVGVRRRRS